MQSSISHRLAGAMCAIAVLFAAVPGSARADAKDVLFAAYTRMVESHFATVTVDTDASGKQTRATAEFETIKRIRLTNDSGGFVILPEGTWMRSGADGEWSKPPFDLGGMIKKLVPQSLEDMRAMAKNILDEGDKTIDGVALRAISYDVDTKVMGISVSAHTTVFIDAGGRIVRTESDGVAMGRKSHSVQTTRYDDSIKVSAPAG